MKTFSAIVMCVALMSCTGTKTIVSSSRSDSLDVNRKIEITQRVVYVPVLIDVPAQRVVEVAAPSDTSVVETDFARSVSYVRADGLLYHDIVNKPQSIPIEVPVTITDTTDTTVSEHSAAEIREIPVRLPLTWWQLFWCRSGQIAWGICTLIIVGIVGRILLKSKL